MSSNKHITYEMWEAGVSFDKVAVPGDTVDEEIVDHFLNCVPPASQRRDYIQCGEPTDHIYIADKGWYAPIYTTFSRTAEGWLYCGDCLRGEKIHRESNCPAL